LGNLNGGTTNFLVATHTLNHTAETFAGGTILLGADAQNLASGGFSGLITEASLFTNALTSVQVQQYFLGALTKAGSSTALASSSNPSGYLGSVSFTASITPSTASGSVIFLANGVPLSTNTLMGGSATSLSVTTLPRGTNVIQAIYSGDANYSASTNTLNQVVTNHPPVAGSSFTMGAPIGALTTVQIIGGKWAPTDVDNDALVISSVTGAANGSVTTDGTNVTYTATSGTTDSFTYTVSDQNGGTASANVSVTISAPSQGFNQLGAQMVSGNAHLTYLGIPGTKSALDWTHNLSAPVTWDPLVTNTAAGNGYLLFTNTPSGGADFYRTRFVP